MAATMKDIAKQTGLGLATISKYMNGGTVRQKNRVLIEKAIQDLDFTVNEFARSLKTSRSRTIGVLIPELSNGFITSIITVIEDILRQNGYGIIVCDSRSSPKLQEEAVGFLLGKRVDGIIMMPIGADSGCLSPVFLKEIPVVLIDRPLDDTDGRTGSVLVENSSISKQSTQHLLENGHRKIGLIAGPKDVFTSKQRLEGYRKALEEKRIPFEQRHVVYGGYTIEGGYEAMNSLLLQAPDITAVFVTNYEMTIGAMLAVNEKGIQLPQELSFIGFDNQELARIVKPNLTIVEQPIREIGEKAAQQLLEQLQKKAPPQQIVLNARLQMGESVKNIQE